MADSTSERIRLFAFGTGWGVPFATSAPFPLKLATWLRMAGLPFDFVIANDPGKGPKGKSPWIEHGTVRMGDSTLIIEYLEERFSIDLDAHLDARQRALAVSVQRMLEEHFHQCFEHQLFFGRGGEERLHEFADSMPIPLRWLVPTVLKRVFSKQLYARGMGRHSEEVIIAQGKSDLEPSPSCSATSRTSWVIGPRRSTHASSVSSGCRSTSPATTRSIDTGPHSRT